MARMTLSWRTVLQIGLLGGLVAVGLNTQNIEDQIALYSFSPSADLAPLIEGLGLTDSAKAILYRAQPKLDDKAAFNADCQTGKGELELGCFYRGRIYILRIVNPSLAPEMTAVLAHELLHAEWARLSDQDQQRLGAELTSVYSGLHDTVLSQRMTSYAQSEPGEQNNELHSILGTEAGSLTPPLEAEYGKLFTDRQLIVKAHEQYQGVFDQRRNQLNAELAQIQGLKSAVAQVNATLAADKSAGRYSAYNALIPRQNSLVDQVNAMISDYQTGVTEYNSLSKSLDSTQLDPTIR